MATRMKFTDRAIKALPIPGPHERAEYADTEAIGLRLRVSSSGIKTFSLLRRVKKGPMERLTLGRFDDIKTERARTKAAHLIGVIAGGANPAEVERAHKGELTFAELFTKYLEKHAKEKKRTWRDDEQQYRDYLREPLGKKKISRISRQDLASIHAKLTHTGRPILANRVKDLFSSVFGRAIKWGFLEDNPERSRDRFLKPGELPRFFAALSEEPNQAFRDFFMLALLTGARRANVRAMAWVDLDLDRGEWRIPRTKNEQPVNVPLVPEAVTILKARQETSTNGARFVFPAARTDSAHGHMSGERKAWLRLLDRDEIVQLRLRIEANGRKVDCDDSEYPMQTLERLRATARRLKINTNGTRLVDIRIHDLRRTMGSWQARTGASLVIIGKGLGHKSQQATAVYARLDIDPVRESMERATSAMLVAAGVKKEAAVQPLKAKPRRR
jgi:integrase